MEEEVKAEKEENIEEIKDEIKKEKKKSKFSKKSLILLIVGIILIVVGTGICIYASINNGNDKKTNTTAKGTASKKEKKEIKTPEGEIKSNIEMEEPEEEPYDEDDGIVYKMPSNPLTDFDLYFMKQENIKKNMVYSPISIKNMLSMLEDAAAGETKTQLSSVLNGYEVGNYPSTKHLSFANMMFIKDDFKDKVKDAYMNKISSKYNGEIVFDSFANANNINKRISDNTFGQINNLLSDREVQSMRFYLINALGIDMNWNYKIQCAIPRSTTPCKENYYYVKYDHEQLDEEEIFDSIGLIGDIPYPSLKFNNTKDSQAVRIGAIINNYDIIKDLGEDNIRKIVSDDYIKNHPNASNEEVNEVLNRYIKEIKTNYHHNNTSTDYRMYDDNEVKMFAKELKTTKGMTLEYVGIMPKTEELSSFINKIDAKKINNLIGSLKEMKSENFPDGKVYKIIGLIPLFKMEYQLDLGKDLTNLGITNIFDINKSDLSNLTDTKNIIDIVNKTTIEFSNDGIKASAVARGGGAGDTHGWDYFFEVPYEIIDLTFDKPYMFLIRNKDTGEVWFAGTVYEPNDYVKY